MAIFHQNLPASVRFGPPQHGRGMANDRRPYLVTAPVRKSTATKQTTATRQFFTLFPHEAEDARITGTTRSLYRRLLALNLPRPVARVEAAELIESEEIRFTSVGTRIA
ncbi:MAG TPA: hypothetical protein VNU92_02645 [Edaphobacter sp.]|jgi:hypothetical protein|nr:hypothetical protein [Edaphobacter sp.]